MLHVGPLITYVNDAYLSVVVLATQTHTGHHNSVASFATAPFIRTSLLHSYSLHIFPDRFLFFEISKE